MFYDNFVKACNFKNVSPSSVAEEIGLNRAAVTGWKNGAIPRDSTIEKLADYFGISKTDLIGSTTLKVTKVSVLPSGLSAEALSVAMAFDRADCRAKDMVRLALEPFYKKNAD